MPNREDPTPVNFRIPAPVYAALEAERARTGVARTALLTTLVMEALDERRRRRVPEGPPAVPGAA